MTSPVPGGYGRIARPQCGSHEGLMLHHRSGEAPCVWCAGQGRAGTGAIPPRDPPPPPPAAPGPRAVPEAPPEPSGTPFRYFLTSGGILVGSAHPGAVLLALAESGDATEIGAGQAGELMAARNRGAA